MGGGMQGILDIVGRKRLLLQEDLARAAGDLTAAVGGASFLVLGGAGSIGQQVVRELFARRPKRLHVVDLSENNLVELVRDLRSSLGYIPGDFRTLPLDCGSPEFAAYLRDQEPFEYVLNLSALKHVRSEKDPYTLMRMIRVNILNTEATVEVAARTKARKYFAVSTDKAVNPANAMGATKRVMELCLLRASRGVAVSTARFANVAFSDGSLLHGFRQRLQKRQPLSAPRDVLRYFMTAEEAGQLCLLSCLLGNTRELFFPKPSPELPLTAFPGIAERFLRSQGYEAEPCATEEEARRRVEELAPKKKWPCYFFSSDTPGEKEAEEFYAPGEDLDLQRFRDVGVIRNPLPGDFSRVEEFLAAIRKLLDAGRWDKGDLAELLLRTVPEFQHKAAGRSLDDRM
jgi:FlaA1/EpsC-like NDP-sugar epimerase